MDAETKRYIDQQIFKLRKEILHAISTSGLGSGKGAKGDKGEKGEPGEVNLTIVEEGFYGTVLKMEIK